MKMLRGSNFATTSALGSPPEKSGETGFKGHVAQEFIPARPDVLASLKQGMGICDV